jgi:hypothetical protein
MRSDAITVPSSCGDPEHVGPCRTNGLRDLSNRQSLSVEHHVDPVQRRHRGMEALHLIEQVFQSKPSVGFASDDSLPQSRRVRVQSGQQVVVGTESGEQVCEMRLRLDDLGNDEERRTKARVRITPGPKMLAALRQVRKRKRPRHLINVDACMRDLILRERIEQRRERYGLAGTGRPGQHHSEHADESSTRTASKRAGL